MHRILTDQPEHRRLVGERAKLAEARQAFQTRQAEAEAVFRQALADHAQEAHQALLEGREAPPAPTYEPPAGDYSVFTSEESRLTAAEQRFYAEQGAELRRALADREAELMREAEVVLLSQLAPIVDELNRVLDTARVVDAGARAHRNAYGAWSGDESFVGGIYQGDVDVQALIDAVRTRRRFVGMGEPQPERPARVIVSEQA